MEIKLHEVPIREIFVGYRDDQENGVVGFHGRLNIRPAFQREFIYEDKERNAVIDTVKKGFPLNVMYWAKSGEDSYELMDGQQRTISVCQYLDNIFEHNGHLFDGLTGEEQEQILNYPLMIYVCDGTEREKLDWFKIINIAGKQLSAQELRNAVYTGEWLTDAKKYFSKTNCPAYVQARDYLKGVAIRQDYLETVIRWIADRQEQSIETYMAEHQLCSNATELWLYFESVISWVRTIFPKFRKEMQGIEWGLLYNQYHERHFDPVWLEEQVSLLMQDEDVTNKKGIYQYLLSGDEKHLNIRAFSPNMKRQAYERQNGICPHCQDQFAIDDMEGDHITPWHEGGPTSSENCQMLCKSCNRRKSGK